MEREREVKLESEEKDMPAVIRLTRTGALKKPVHRISVKGKSSEHC